MPNFKPIVRKDHTSKNGVARIYIQVPFKGRTDRLKTDYYIDPKFMQDNGKVKDTHPLAAKINLGLTREVMKCWSVFASGRFNNIRELMDALKRDESGEGADFFTYAEKRADELHAEKRFSSENGIRSLITILKEMYKQDTLPFYKIDSEFILRLKDHLMSHDKSINTVIAYNRRITTIINYAVLKKVIDPKKLPSRNIYLKAEKPSIRLLGVSDLQKILQTDHAIPTQRAVDLFFLSFYLMGLNPKDILYIKKEQVHKDRIIIKRSKTLTPLSIKIPPQVYVIINKYKGTKYLLNFLDKNDKYMNYMTLTSTMNYYLRNLSESIGLGVKLSLKYARSSFATIASSKPLEIPLEVIDFAQGRKIKGETSRYVRYDLDRIDEAQEKVIALVTSKRQGDVGVQ